MNAFLLGVTLLAQAGLTAPEPPGRPWVSVVVEATPDTVDVGTGTAQLSIQFQDTEGNPVDVPEARVEADTGKITDVTPDGQGRFRATYTAPAGSTPSVDAVYATDESTGAIGWVSIGLAATATIPVSVDKPGAQVTVTFAGRDVGPVTADERGRASVELRVPPGDWRLTVRAVDKSGNETVTTEKLPVPEYRRVWAAFGPLACAPGALPGGWLDAFAVTPSGRPAVGARPRVESRTMAFSEGVAIGAGHLRYMYVAKAGPSRKEKAQVRYAGSSASAEVTVGGTPDVSDRAKQLASESEKALIETRAYITKTFDLLEKAREERDLVLLRCVQEKFTRMKALTRVSERAHEGLRRDLAECRDAAVERNHEKVTSNRDQVKRLSAEAEACLNQGDSFAQNYQVNVEGPDDDDAYVPDEPDLDIFIPPDDASPFN